MSAEDVRELWWAIQRIQDELTRDRQDAERVLRHLAKLEQRVTAIESRADA